MSTVQRNHSPKSNQSFLNPGTTGERPGRWGGSAVRTYRGLLSWGRASYWWRWVQYHACYGSDGRGGWCSGWKTLERWLFCPAARSTEPKKTPVSTTSRGPARRFHQAPSPTAPPPTRGRRAHRRPFRTPFVQPAGKSASQKGVPMSGVIHGSNK